MALTRAAALTFVAAYLGLFVGLIDANAVNLALPAIRDDLGGGIAGAQWTIDAYNITFATATGAVLHRLDRAAPPSGGRSGPGRARPLPLGRLAAPGTAPPRADGDRYRPFRAGPRVQHRLACLTGRLQQR